MTIILDPSLQLFVAIGAGVLLALALVFGWLRWVSEDEEGRK